MGLRKRLWSIALAISFVAAIASGWSGAYLTSLALICAGFFLFRRAKASVPDLSDLQDWLIALEGKDPFNPDTTPNYTFRGFATTFVAAMSVTNHPTLMGKTLVVFRDEVQEDQWKSLITRVKHGPHAVRKIAAGQRWF